jgi:hypothetical protein
MAALIVAGGTVLPFAHAGSAPAPAPAQAEDKPASPKNATVFLLLRIAESGREGCDVEIKPGHSGCHFQPVRKHVDAQGKLTVRIDDVTTTSADRECAFAITVREPGQANRTVRRGLRLPPPGTTAYPSIECYITSPSKLARTEKERVTR